MRPLCLRKSQLHPRVFQDTCRLFSGRRRPGRTIAKPPPLPEQIYPEPQTEEQHPDVRWFVQDAHTGKITRVAGDPEEIEAQKMKQKIRELQAELRQYRVANDDELDPMMLAALEPGDRMKVQRAWDEEQRRITEITEGLSVQFRVPRETTPILNQFNKDLRNAALEPEKVQNRVALWKSYMRTKQHIAELPALISPKAWDSLWAIQCTESAQNPDWVGHVLTITNDKLDAGLALRPDEQYRRIEALYAAGDKDSAVNEYERLWKSAQPQQHSFYELGVRLYERTSQLDRALEVLQVYFRECPDANPRIVKALIPALCHTGDEQMAFALYLLLRQKLGSEMTMKEYDSVTLIFLLAGKKDFALAVFRDLMLQAMPGYKDFYSPRAGELRYELRDTYRAMMTRLNALMKLSVDPLELNKACLTALTALPRQWQNKFFFASWLRKLIAMNQLDAAAKVVELMYERGVHPDPIHINGLMAAYLRTGYPELEKRGEELGWAMIQRRVDCRWLHRQSTTGPGRPPNSGAPAPSVRAGVEGIKLPVWMSREVPSASPETFCVLVLYYLVNERYEHVAHLHRMLRPAEIGMNAYFMNQLLYAELYSQRYGPRQVWQKFLRLTEPDENGRMTRWDVETYEVLWQTELRFLDRTKQLVREGFPMPRKLFAHMIAWHAAFTRAITFDAKKVWGINRETLQRMHDQIVRCFCYERDLAGLLVAMHGLFRTYGQWPSDEAQKLILLTVSNMNTGFVPSIRGRRRTPISRSSEKWNKVEAALKSLRTHRDEAARIEAERDGGMAPEQRSEEQAGEEKLALLSEFLRAVMVRTMKDPKEVEEQIALAATEMGLGGVTTGDITAFAVA